MKTVENRNALRAAITMEHYPILERLLLHEIRYQNSTWSNTGRSKVDSESLVAGFRRKRTRRVQAQYQILKQEMNLLDDAQRLAGTHRLAS